jgi:hypothetical protein
MDVTSHSFVQDNLDLFWQFVHERQLVWRRRVVQGLPPPWTEDPILQRERFTNVYRELDPGTQYVINEILEISAPRPDKLFNVMLYRLVGRSETHSAVGFQFLTTFSPSALEETLKTLRASGKPPFTAAYMVSAYSTLGSSDKIENIARLFGRLRDRFFEVFALVERSSSLAEAHSVIGSEYGFGNFLSYQILVDSLYPLRIYGGRGLLPFSQDEWASAGPGAQRGIRRLLKSPNNTRQYLDVMRWLRDNQVNEFNRVGLNFPYLEDSSDNPILISLPNIQNCLCEFHKYVKIQEGTGRGRRKFVANAAINAPIQMAIPPMVNRIERP